MAPPAFVVVFCPVCAATVDAQVTDTDFACECGQAWTMTIQDPARAAANIL